MKSKSAHVIFSSGNTLSTEFGHALFDPSTYNRYPTLAAYFQDNKIKASPAEVAKLQKIVRTQVLEQMRSVVWMSYQKMKVSNNWGDAGRFQCEASFARSLFDIPFDQEVGSDTMRQFYEAAEAAAQELSLAHLTPEALNNRINEFKITLFSHDFRPKTWRNLEKLLRFLEIPFFLVASRKGTDKTFLLGEGKLTNTFGYDVIMLEKEHVRSPSVIVAMAALIYERRIIIRRESLETIFTQKWQRFVGQPKLGFDAAYDISWAIRSHVLSLYGVTDEASLLKVKKQFLDEMAETIIYHEIGHGGVGHDIVQPKLNAIGNSTVLFGDSIYHDLLEFMADFVPKTGKIKGPIQNMVDVAKKDPKKALRLYFMYVSDTWFFDTGDTYMYPYSTIMAMVLGRYIQPDLSVDFAQLEKDIQNEAGTPFKQIVSLFENGVLGIEEIAKKAKYGQNGEHTFTFTDIHKMNVDGFRKKNVVMDELDSRYLDFYWSCILNNVKLVSDSNQKVVDYLADRHEKLLKRMFLLFYGSEATNEYNMDYSAFIFEKFQQIFKLNLNSPPTPL